MSINDNAWHAAGPDPSRGFERLSTSRSKDRAGAAISPPPQTQSRDFVSSPVLDLAVEIAARPILKTHINKDTQMALGKRHLKALRKLVAATEKLVSNVEREMAKVAAQKKVRLRRSRKDAAHLKREVRADRRKGLAATRIAKKHGISLNYVYLLLR
jgi:hypothetical protein